MEAHPKNGGDYPAKDDKRDSGVVRLFKFFDRHNGSFNAVAALAVAFFTWRLWRLSAQEVAALGQQSEDVKKSIAEATRAATAMEMLAKSAAETVEATHSVAAGTIKSGEAARVSANAMEIMAEAAKRSADAASAVQRPWIKLTVGKPSAAYVKDGRLYVPTPVTLTNVGMTPPNGFGMGFDCDTHSGSGKITIESVGEKLDRPTISPLVIQDVIYPNDPYEIVRSFSVPLDKIGADQREGFFITATFHIHYFWAGGRGQVGLNVIIRPAGRGATKFKLDEFSEGKSVPAVVRVLDTFTS